MMLIKKRLPSFILVVIAVLLGLVPQAYGGGLTLENATFFGGTGDQRGMAAAIKDRALYVTGYDYSMSLGLALKYELPLAAGPTWVNYLTAGFNAVAIRSSGVFLFGAAGPNTCGVIDNVGGWESKPILAHYSVDGTFLECDTVDLFSWNTGSTSFFVYSGGETYDAAVAVESPTPYIYATGYAENCGFWHLVFELAKYDANGNLLIAATEPGVNWDEYNCMGGSEMNAITELNGDLYLAGYSSLFDEDSYSSYISGNSFDVKAVLMRYNSSLNRVWKQRVGDVGPSRFFALTSLNSAIYAVGNTQGSGSPDGYLIEKYDQDGQRIWSRVTPVASGAALTGIVAVANKLYAVGWTRDQSAGDTDAVLLEIDPATGATLSTTLHGGLYDDMASAVVTDGTDLYVIGESRSFGSNDGNVVGENDLVILRYSITAQVEIDIKPGSFPNSINPKSKGKIPVAILSTSEFDAPEMVDIDSLTFGRTGDEDSLAFCDPKPKNKDKTKNKGKNKVEDLICHFYTEDTGFECGDTKGVLKGMTMDGTPIQGSDSVRINPCKN